MVQIWEWCLERHIFPMVVYIATHDNTITDEFSRLQTKMNEWSLDLTVYHNLCNLWGSPNIDMFANHNNTKCNTFYSRARIGRGSQGDALMAIWSTSLIYKFPPIPLLLRTISKIRLDHANSHCSMVAETTLVHTAKIHEQQPSSPLSNSTPALSAMVCFHQIW